MNKIQLETLLKENPAAMAAVQQMSAVKLQGKGKRKVKATTALTNKDHPSHQKAVGIFQKLKDKFSKKKEAEPKKQSQSDIDFYKKQYAARTGKELKEGWWDNMGDAAKKAYIKKHGSAPNVAGDDEPKVPAPDSKSDTGKPRVSANPYDDNYGQEVDDEDDKEKQSKDEPEQSAYDKMGPEARELKNTMDSTEEGYKQQYIPILKNLSKKMKKGTYDKEKAVKLMMYYVSNGAKRYEKDFGGGGATGPSVGGFDKKTREEAARAFVEDFEDDWDNKNWDFMESITFNGNRYRRINEGWWEDLSDKSQKSYIKKHGGAPNSSGKKDDIGSHITKAIAKDKKGQDKRKKLNRKWDKTTSKAADIAKDMGGNMTGAVKKIEKIKKGLSDDPKVKAALRKANESKETKQYIRRNKMKITEDILRKVIRSEIKKTLITESSPGFTKREFGDPLPTLSGVMKQHQNKVVKEDEDAFSQPIPATIDRFMKKFIASVNDKNLNRKRKLAILGRVIVALKLEPSEVSKYARLVKREL